MNRGLRKLVRVTFGLTLSGLVSTWGSAHAAFVDVPGMASGGAGSAPVGGLATTPNPPTTTTPSVVLPGRVDPGVYTVGPGDVFLVNLTGRVTDSAYLTVAPEGSLFLPWAGPVQLDGVTLTQAKQRMMQTLERQLRGVQIDISLARVRQMRIYLVGDVRVPGAVDLPASSRVSDALTISGMLEGASQRNIEVLHRDGNRQVADLLLFHRSGRFELNPYLRDGDVVRVPSAVRFVSIEGAVPRGGGFELGPFDSLSTLLDIAGHPIPSSRMDRALLVRWRTASERESVWFSVQDVYSRGWNPILTDGDRVFLYFIPRFHRLDQATILGDVGSPGTYPLADAGMRLTELVRQAGGFGPQADLSTVRVRRSRKAPATDKVENDRLTRLSRDQMTDSEYGAYRAGLAAEREEFRVDWNRLQSSPELDFVLSDADTVLVGRIEPWVRVEGEVRRPGIVRFEAGRSITDYVGMAGGFSRRAARGKVRITQSGTGQNQLARDVPGVSPGDHIWVPERPDVSVWQRLQTLVAVAAQVATVVIAVRR